ncbi:energy transducer TonB [Halodesulfovibrio sp.]|jgi:protein TonB|uniref:energy transducer TonB n=1 Tax=Halodesulfovibrio sp. TaxID=1912772 RepID=UPI0025F29C22|nr:energy transducer TonB [Halodesulfovibrio sp.]MCT4535895.1 energy transducer TonB [Halodesulfovibrio sp.]
MIRPPFSRLQWILSCSIAAAFAVVLILAPSLFKQETEPDKITRFRTTVSLRQIPPKAEEEEPPPEEEKKPEPPAEEPVAIMELSTPPVSPVQPDLLDVDIAANLSLAVPVNIPRQVGTLGIGDVDEAPIPIYTPPPLYPARAKRRRIETNLLVKMVIKADGTVAKPHIVTGEHQELFSSAALQAVKKWRFKPARLHGKAVAVLVSLPLEFTCTN